MINYSFEGILTFILDLGLSENQFLDVAGKISARYTGSDPF